MLYSYENVIALTVLFSLFYNKNYDYPFVWHFAFRNFDESLCNCKFFTSSSPSLYWKIYFLWDRFIQSQTYILLDWNNIYLFTFQCFQMNLFQQHLSIFLYSIVSLRLCKCTENFKWLEQLKIFFIVWQCNMFNGEWSGKRIAI